MPSIEEPMRGAAKGQERKRLTALLVPVPAILLEALASRLREAARVRRGLLAPVAGVVHARGRERGDWRAGRSAGGGWVSGCGLTFEDGLGGVVEARPLAAAFLCGREPLLVCEPVEAEHGRARGRRLERLCGLAEGVLLCVCV